MSLQNTDRFRYLYVGLEPPYPFPNNKPNYTSYSAKEEQLNGYCLECEVENTFLTAIRPYIGPYHHKSSERYSDGMPPLMYNYSGRQKCSHQLQKDCDQQRVEQYMRKYGLYWEVPWQKYKTKYMYATTTKDLSYHEKNPLLPAHSSIDKVNSTLLVTEQGCLRNVPGLCDSSRRRIRTAFYEDDYPNGIYQPPNWTNYTY